MRCARKGQSSVEYLGTYAWAFMGLLITLGAMSYFGVFNPNSYTPENCQSGSQISCNDYLLATNNDGATHFLIQLRNNYAKDIVITDFNITAPSTLHISPNIIVEPGRLVTMSIPTNQYEANEGNLVDIDFEIGYKRSGGAQRYNIHGDALVEVVMIPFTYVAGNLNDASPFCGDGHTDTGMNEDCDPTTMLESGISQVSCNGGDYACRSDCSCYGSCGDGVWQKAPYGDEECEVDADCSIPGQTCTNDCECV